MHRHWVNGINRLFCGALLAVGLSAAPTLATPYYVVTNGNDGAAGTSWETALLTISNAVAKAVVAGDEVVVSNGVYNITNQIGITNAIIVRSVNGREVTTINRLGTANHRLIYCTDSGAVIDGFTISGGNVVSEHGGGAYLTGGSLLNCLIENNKATTTSFGGGGAYLAGASVVSNCLIRSNSGSHNGGGLYMNGTSVLVRDCILSNNVAIIWGGAADVANGNLVNCLVVRNRISGNHASYGGGGIRLLNTAQLLNCTLAYNSVGDVTPGAGLQCSTTAFVTNCIVYYNTQGNSSADISGTPRIGFSCSPGLSGNGNISQAPDFEDPAGHNYRPRISSPCVDAGTNTTLAADINGMLRPSDSRTPSLFRTDMGAYELPPATSGVLRCSFAFSNSGGLGSASVVFSASVGGSNTTGLVYAWDTDDNGTWDFEGTDRQIITNEYTEQGTFSVRLQVSNTLGQVVQFLREDVISIVPSTLYVDRNGSHISPYGSWATAATNLAAVEGLLVDNMTVLVSNGTYALTGMLINNAVNLRSVNGPEVTILKNFLTGRLLTVKNSGATVEGFTLTGGALTGGSGGAVWLDGATLRNCMVTNNTANSDGEGGAIYMQGASLVENCLIAGNTGRHYSGGVRMSTTAAGLLQNCTISNNVASFYGGGVDLSGGTMRNCLIVRNRLSGDHPSYGGGGVRLNAGTILNCTIANNSVLAATPGGGVLRGGGSMTNCIVYHNLKGVNADNFSGSAATVGFSCASEFLAGNGNTAFSPDFVSKEDGNYSLLPGSPCIDTGTNLASVTVDMAGTVRPIDGNGDEVAIHDMGAFEAAALGGGPLTSSFTATGTEGMDSLQSVFEASTAGANTSGLFYWWDFENDGVWDQSGADAQIVTNIYNVPGIYDVRLLVSNAVAETSSIMKQGLVTVFASSLYVDVHGSHTTPFTNWSMAATNLRSAVDLAGDGSIVTVNDGTYVVSELILNHGLSLHSVNGPTNTTLKGSGSGRLLEVMHTNVTIDGFTLTGGYRASGSGGAVWLKAGTMRNCIVTNNQAIGGNEGAAVYMTGTSLVENCVFSGNRGQHYSGGVWLNSANAMLRDCIVSNNQADIWGAGVYLSAGTVRNCLISRNRLTGNHTSYGGGGIFQGGGKIENCTVAYNTVPADTHGGGLWASAGVFTNCIIYGNLRGGNAGNIEATSLAGAAYSCSPDLQAGVNHNITNSPLFVNADANDFTLSATSACVNSGIAQPWMDATAKDLAKAKRIQGPLPDMGAYEWQAPSGTLFIIR